MIRVLVTSVVLTTFGLPPALRSWREAHPKPATVAVADPEETARLEEMKAEVARLEKETRAMKKALAGVRPRTFIADSGLRD